MRLRYWVAALVLAILVSPAFASAQDDLTIRGSLTGTVRGIFDPGIHKFSESSYIPTITARGTVMPSEYYGIDLSYSYSELGTHLSNGGHSMLTSHVIDLGARVESPLRAGPLTPFARAGLSMYAARAQFKDYTRYRDWSQSFGAYGAVGIFLGSTLSQTLGAAYPETGVGLTAEVGHVQAFNDLTFEPFGTLKMGGLYYSVGLELVF